MAEINRVWLNVDTDTNKITLFDRPRVSIHVDEYIWSLIEEHIVKPHKLMRSEKHRYLLKISFHRFDPVQPAQGQQQQGDEKPSTTTGLGKKVSSLLGQLGEMWNESEYTDEFDVDTFLSKVHQQQTK